MPTSPAVCPRCGKRLVPFTMGDGVPVCDCEPEKEEHDEKYIFFNGKYWKVEDLELTVIDEADPIPSFDDAPKPIVESGSVWSTFDLEEDE